MKDLDVGVFKLTTCNTPIISLGDETIKMKQ